MKATIAFFIRGYQLLISPLLPPSCRFYPSCSEYTLQAVSRYGGARGLWLGIKRLLRCHPYSLGGVDELD
ncbi:MAG: membrane protein insertion efficiency factor YidD [Candidatus Eisenbacteria bacterium]